MELPLLTASNAESVLEPTCSSLEEPIRESRWLSIPGSRIVINPSEVTQKAVYQEIAGAVPLNTAYYVGERPVRLPYFIAWETDSAGAAVTEMTWAPHELTNVAETSDGLVRLETSTCFANEDTLVQLLKVKQTDGSPLILSGRFSDGEAEWDEEKNLIILKHKDFTAAVAASRPAQFVELSGEEQETRAWILKFDDLKPGSTILIAASFSPSVDLTDDTAKHAIHFASPGAYLMAIHEREKEWNRLLSEVPQPLDFNLHTLTREVTPDAMKRMYYKAWIFMLSDTLPPTLENGYPYPQVACGKPSLWDEGHPKAKPSCQWESFIAMQFLAEMDPETMWSAFEGMMSLVDDEGTLGGEGLPSRHVQTAWKLYSVTGDQEKLRRVYPALKRLLLWKARDPRWIYRGATPEDSRDSEFVVHALLDMLHMKHVAGALEMPDEVSFWQSQIENLREKYVTWFWEKPGGKAYRFYSENNRERDGAGHSWSLQGLLLPPEVLGQDERNSLVNLLHSLVQDDIPFLIGGLNKYPSHNYTLRGVYHYGLVNEALKMAEAAISAVTLAGEFGECYSDAFPVVHSGVAPSVFGAENVIDTALWKNGVMISDGLPVIVRPPYAAGVKNLKVQDESLSVSFYADDVVLDGKALHELRLPDGFSETELPDGGLHWEGKMSVGGQIALEKKAK